MWGTIVKFFAAGARKLIPGPLWLLVMAFSVGTTVGAATAWKIVRAQDRAEYEALMDQKDRAYALAMDAQRALFNDRLRLAEGRVTVKEVVKYVEDNRACDLSPDAAGLLDAHGQGLPDTAAGTAGSAGGSAAPVGVSQRQMFMACADYADRLTACRQQIIRLRQFFGVE